MQDLTNYKSFCRKNKDNFKVKDGPTVQAGPQHGEGGTSLRAKYSLAPQCLCYSRGHLRALRVTGWTEEVMSDGSEIQLL